MKYRALYYGPQTTCNNLCSTNANQIGNFDNDKSSILLSISNLRFHSTVFVIFLSLECSLNMTRSIKKTELSCTLYPKKSIQIISHLSPSSNLNNIYIEYVQMTKKHLKRCSISLIIRETQIKTAMSYHLTPVRMAVIKTSTNNRC